VDESTDAAAQDFAERPRFLELAHQCVEVVLGWLIIGGTHSKVGLGDHSVDGFLFRRVEEVAFQEANVEIGSAVFEPAFGENGFRLTNCAKWEQVAIDIVRLVNVRLD
jgi:hypothetical protein